MLGVVEHHQSPCLVAQFAQHPRDSDRNRVARLDQSQRPRQFCQAVRNQFRLSGRYPPHHVVVCGVPVNVLDRGTGLTHPGHPCDRPHHHRARFGQRPVQFAQQFLPPSESRQSSWHVPHPDPGTTPGARTGELHQSLQYRDLQCFRRRHGRHRHTAITQPPAERFLPGAEPQVTHQLRWPFGVLV
jgi:hypothetical protein